MFFSSRIVSNPNYLKYKKIRGVVFTIFIFYCTPAFFILQNGDSLIADLEAMPWLRYYLLGAISISIIYGILHYLTWKINMVGIIEISEDGILFIPKQSSKVYFPYKSINRLEIIRNSTFHKEEDNFTIPYTANNWIRFKTAKEKEYNLEFLIQSEDHNEEFEEMIRFLKTTFKNRIIFKSI